MRKKIKDWHEVARFWQSSISNKYNSNTFAILNNYSDIAKEFKGYLNSSSTFSLTSSLIIVLPFVLLFFLIIILKRLNMEPEIVILLALISFLSLILAIFIIYLHSIEKFKIEIICCEEGIIDEGRHFTWDRIENITIRENELKLILEIKGKPSFLIINLYKLTGHFITPKEIFSNDIKVFISENEINMNNLNLAALNLLYILKRRAFKAKWGGDVKYHNILPG